MHANTHNPFPLPPLPTPGPPNTFPHRWCTSRKSNIYKAVRNKFHAKSHVWGILANTQNPFPLPPLPTPGQPNIFPHRWCTSRTSNIFSCVHYTIHPDTQANSALCSFACVLFVSYIFCIFSSFCDLFVWPALSPPPESANHQLRKMLHMILFSASTSSASAIQLRPTVYYISRGRGGGDSTSLYIIPGSQDWVHIPTLLPDPNVSVVSHSNDGWRWGVAVGFVADAFVQRM